MTTAHKMDALIARLSTIANAHPELLDFWNAVDAEMEPITAGAETEADQRVVADRYSDLITEADVIGMIRPE